MGVPTDAEGPIPPTTPRPEDDAAVWSTPEPEITGFLADHLGATIAPVHRIGQGAWSRCLGFRHDGQDLVIRLGTHPDDFERDRWVGVALADSALPVPQVLEIGQAFGCSFAIATRVDGAVIEDADDNAWSSLWTSLLGMLDRIHAVDIDHQPGFGTWTPTDGGAQPSWRDHLLAVGEDTATCRTPGWRQKLSTVAEADRTFARGHAQLASLAECLAVPRSLAHADTLHGNVLITGSTITGLLDWGSSVWGDPLYDHAWLLFWAPWHPGLASVADTEAVHRHLRSVDADLDDFDERLRACLLHIGLDHLTYNAHKERWRELRRVARATLALIDD